MLIGIGRTSRPGAKRPTLGHFEPCAWAPVSENRTPELRASSEALQEAMASGDLAELSRVLSASAGLVLQEAVTLSHDASQTLGEVVLTDKGLARPPSDVLALVLHEAAHALAWQRGAIKDISRQGRYHNQRFKTIAEEVGLDVSRDPLFGWSSTTVPATTASRYEDALAVLERALNGGPERLRFNRRRPTVQTLMCGCAHRTRSTRTACAPVAVVCTACAGGWPHPERA